MAQQIYPFTNAGNYTFDSNKVDISSGTAKLKVIPSAPITNFRNFDTPGNWIFDLNKVEFVGGVAKLKDQQTSLPQTMAGTYPIDGSYDINYVADPLAPTVGSNFAGSPTVANGEVDMSSQGTQQSISYSGTMSRWQTGLSGTNILMRLGVRLNYTGDPGAPTQEVPIISFQTGTVDSTSLLHVYHDGDGNIKVDFKTPISAVENVMSFPYSHPSAGDFVELAIHSVGSGFFALYANGTLVGSGNPSGNPGASLFLGNYNYCLIGDHPTSETFAENSAFWFRYLTFEAGPTFGASSITVFDEVNFPATPFSLDPQKIDQNDDLIDETGSNGVNDLLAYTTTEVKPANTEIKYAVSNDSGSTWNWWNGANIVLSDNTFNQANTLAEWQNPIVASALQTFIQATDKLRIRVWLSTTDGTSNPEIDYLETSHDVIGFDLTNPDILTNVSFNASTLTGFVENAVISGSDQVKYQLVLDGINKYWNGSAWVNGAGFAQSNTASEVNTNIASFLTLTNGAEPVQVRMFLSSATGGTTPEVDSLTIDFTVETSSPFVTQFDPASGSVDVAVAQSAQVTFNEPLDPATAIGANIFLTDEGNGSIPVTLSGPPTLSNGNQTVTLDPLSDLDPSNSYKINVTTNVTDVAGNPAVADEATFFTEVGEPPFEAVCFVFGTVRKGNSSPVEGARVTAFPLMTDESAVNNVLFIPIRVTATTNDAGAFQIPLVQSGQYQDSQQYRLKIQYRDFEEEFTVTVPAQATAELKDLI